MDLLTPKALFDTGGDAFVSACGKYRYTLIRTWNSALPCCCFVMLNPSTADAMTDDPTIRRCISFAKENGFGKLVVVNLFAYRATNPSALDDVADPVGEYNDNTINACATSASTVICAWGANKIALQRESKIQAILFAAKITPMCFGLSKGGFPRHPLMLPKNTPLIPYLPEIFNSNSRETKGVK